MMRAKFRVQNVSVYKDDNGIVQGETLQMHAVAREGGYPEDGSDEDNSYARWSPSGDFRIHIANPALFGKFVVGDKYYMDFTKADK
jgi:hypothetical protein